MKLKRLGSIFLAAAMMTAALTGCGGGDSKAEGGDSKAEGGKSTVTLWATGSDNVRSIFEKLTEDFNTNSEYKDQYQVELQFMLSGTGAQGLADMVAAAGKAGQTNTDYDIVDWSGDDLAKIMSKIGEESFVKLDKSKIPNAASVEAKSAVAQDYAQPYRGTTVILAYDSEKVPTPPKTMDELVEWMKANPGRSRHRRRRRLLRSLLRLQLPAGRGYHLRRREVGRRMGQGLRVPQVHPSVYVQVRRLHRLPEQEPGYSGPAEPG